MSKKKNGLRMTRCFTQDQLSTIPESMGPIGSWGTQDRSTLVWTDRFCVTPTVRCRRTWTTCNITHWSEILISIRRRRSRTHTRNWRPRTYTGCLPAICTRYRAASWWGNRRSTTWRKGIRNAWRISCRKSKEPPPYRRTVHASCWSRRRRCALRIPLFRAARDRDGWSPRSRDSVRSALLRSPDG